MVEVGISRCENYRLQPLLAALRQVLAPLGGIERFVRPGQTVLLKPNLLKGADPDQAVTTHPEFIRAVIRLLQPLSVRIYIGDSPAGVVKADAVYERCGLPQLCREESVTLVRFDQVVRRQGLPLARIFETVDVCINLPKLKTHGLTVLTAGVKNMFGAVVGLHKVHCHKKAPNVRVFSRELARVYSLVRPQLTIIDAVTAMEGAGPAGGVPRQVGAIIASADAVAADAVTASLLGLRPFAVPSTRAAFQMGLGEARLEHIRIRGESPEEMRVRDFRFAQPKIFFRLPNGLTRLVLSVIPLHMRVQAAQCVGCGHCVRICPQQAITPYEGKVRIDAKRCILCLCCNEACPHNAIDLRWRNLLS